MVVTDPKIGLLAVDMGWVLSVTDIIHQRESIFSLGCRNDRVLVGMSTARPV